MGDRTSRIGTRGTFIAFCLGSIALTTLPAQTDDPHRQLLERIRNEEVPKYPSAKECAQCHENIYDEWKSSAHAYAAISPMFHRFEQKINDLAQGTVGSFCVRCHIPVGTAMGEPRETALWDRMPISREGVTCVACHRINVSFGKVNGERRIIPGRINEEPMYGSQGGTGLTDVLNDPEKYGIKPEEIHNEAIEFEQITEADFCMPCHQVAVHPGIKLEVVWDQYRAAPAYKHGISCQDCHMGTTPGTNKDGYPESYRSKVNGVEITPGSKHADHSMVGPGYSIAHPGIFPHNIESDDNKFTIKKWMTFNWREAWGSAEFEDAETTKDTRTEFPPEWSSGDDRIEAWRIVEQNLEELAKRLPRRKQIMEIGSRVDGPFFKKPPQTGKKFSFWYEVNNIDEGHNLPSGSLGAQPEIWLNVALIDPEGRNIWESGYVDSYGDMADLHSRDVLNGKLAHDGQLFNLQSKFLTTNVKGTDREMFLPVNVDFDQLPFIRPANVPSTVLNHPPFIRMEQRSIPPLGMKKARYSVPARLLQKSGTYKLAARLRSRAEPIYFMDFVGATPEMVREMNRRMLDFHEFTVEFEVK